MKWYYLLCLLLLDVKWSQARAASENDLQDITKTVNDDSDEDVIASSLKLMEKKCREVGGDGAFEKLTKVMEDSKVCLHSNFPTNKDELKNLVNDSSSSSEEICSEKRGTIRTCFTGLIEALKDCVHEDEKYLPEFIFNAIEATLDYICADQGAVLIKVFNENTLDCVFTLVEKENLTESCINEMKFLEDSTPEEIIYTKDELCHDLTQAKSCYTKIIADNCPKSTDFKEFVAGLYTALSSPCNINLKNPLNLNLPSGNK